MELCRHIFLDGRFCRAAALKDTYFCRHHTSVRATLTQARRAAPHHAHQLLPFAYPEDRRAIDLNLFLVQNALNEGAISTRTANAFTNIMRAQMANRAQIEKTEARQNKNPGAPHLEEMWESNLSEPPSDQTKINPNEDGPVSGHGFSHAENGPARNGASAPAGAGAPHLAEMWNPPSVNPEDKDEPNLSPEPRTLRPLSAQTAIHQIYERFLTEEGEEIAPPRYFPNPDHCHLANLERSTG